MIALLSGEEKTGKTTMAISFPKPMVYLEFDLGGFDRAKSRFKKEELEQIQLVQFPAPLSVDFKSKSLIETIRITGEKERWQRFMEAFNNACMNTEVKTVVIDTWFQLYELSRQAYLQVLQEAQLDASGRLRKGEEKLRESLQQVEYTQPYSKMRSVMFYARAMNKHLVLVTYDADEYKPQLSDDGRVKSQPTGKKIAAGWKETEKHADIALWLERNKQNQIVTRITLPGLAPLEAVGMELPENSYSSLIQVLSMMEVKVA
jgi:hypothetical protein